MIRRFFLLFFFAIVLMGAGWIRVQSIPQLGGKYLFGTDSFRFYRQAEYIDQHGSLPERDMERWLPLGRDLTTYLSLSSYIIAYAAKLLRFFYPPLTTYQTAVYYPVAIFLLTLPLVYLLAGRLFDRLTAFLSVIFLAVLPCVIGRSLAGFPDRDALCLFFGVLSIYGYIRRGQSPSPVEQWMWNLLSGMAILLIGLTWEGAGLFVVILVGTEFIKLVSGSYRQEDFRQYLAWYGVCLIGLLTLTRAYRVNANVSAPFALLTLGTPLFFALLAALYFILQHTTQIAKLITFSGRLPLEIALLYIGGIFIGIFSLILASLSEPGREILLSLQSNFFSVLGRSRLMETVSELKDVSLKRWLDGFGGLYFLASMGALLVLYKLTQQQHMNPWMVIAVFETILISVFYHHALEAIQEKFEAIFYTGSILTFLGICILSRIYAYRQQPVEGNRPLNTSLVVLLCWFCVTLFLSRGANRYQFFFAPPAAILAAYTLSASKRRISRRRSSFLWHSVSWVAITFFVAMLLFFPGVGGYAFKSYSSVKNVIPLFASPAWQQAFAWMKYNLPSNAVVAADWNYGSHLNVLGKCATIVDEDHFIPYWIHLNARHLFCAESEREALEFLKTRGATHVMFTSDDIKNAHSISAIGSNANDNRQFRIMPLLVKEEAKTLHLSFLGRSAAPYGSLTLTDTTHPPGKWHIEKITIVLEEGPNEEHPTIKETEVMLSLSGKPATLPLRRVFLQSHEYITKVEKNKPTFPGGVILTYSADDNRNWRGFYVPEIGYNSLLIQMFLFNKHSKHFKQVYPPVEKLKSDVKIWEIAYPGDIEFRREYLRRTFDDKRLKSAWMFGRE